MNKQPKIILVTGESSGDTYGGCLAVSLKKLCPGIQLLGVGGQQMRQSGVELIFDNRDMAVVGVFEVLSHLNVIVKAFLTIKRKLAEEKPDILVLIDYPDFNLILARIAKRMGIDVVYYVSPQVWAWRAGRVNTIARLVRKMVVLFPFEVPIYEKVGLDTSFVGHPLLDLAKPTESREEFLLKLGLDPQRPVIGLLPGSRRKEVENHIPIIGRSAYIIAQQRPEVQFILPVANTLEAGYIQSYLPREPTVTLAKAQAYDVMNAASLLITASGTATLEAALLTTPMVVVYRVSPFTYWLGRMLVSTEFISLANIVAGTKVVEELIQDEMTPESIADCALSILNNPANEKEISQKLSQVRNSLGEPGASERAARIILDTIETNQ